MRRIVKWTFATCAGLLVLLAVVLVSAPFIVNSHWGQQWLVRQINTAINGGLSWQNLQISLFSGKVSAGQVLLTDKAGKKIVRVARLETGISWPLLLQGVLCLEPVILEKPQVSLEIGSGGTVNIAHAFESPYPASETRDETSPALQIILRSITLSEGRLNFSMPDVDVNVAARGLALSGAADFSKPSAAATLSAEHVHYQGQGVSQDLSGLRLLASLEGQKLNLETLSFKNALSSLKISGAIDGLFDIPQFDISVQLETQLSEIEQVFHFGPLASGLMTLSMTLIGPLDNPRADLQMRYHGGEVGGRKVAGATLRVDLDDMNISVDGSLTDKPSGRITVQGAVDLNQAFAGRRLSSAMLTERIAYRWDIKTSDLDLSGLLPQMPHLTGSLTAAIHGTGTGLLPQNMDSRLSLEAELKQLKETVLRAPVDLRLSGRAAVKKNLLTVSALSFQAGGTRLDGWADFDMGRRKGEARIDVAAADLARDLSLLGIEGISGSLNGRIIAGGSLEKPQFDVSMQGRGLSSTAVKVGDLRLKALMNPEGLLEVSVFTIENGQSRISASGRIPLYDMISGKQMRSDLQLSATLEHLAPRDFVTDMPLAGFFNGRLSAAGRLPELTARATIEGRELESAGVRAARLDADLHLSGADVFLDSLRISSRKSEIRASGRARLLSEQQLALIEDPAFEMRLAGEHLSLADFSNMAGGQVSLDADLKGTFRHPAGTLRIGAESLETKIQETKIQKIASLKLLARLAEDVLHVEDFALALVPEQPIEGRGRIARDGQYSIELAAAGLSLDSIDWVRQRLAAQGDIALTLSGRGSLKKPRLQAQVNLSSLHINQKPFEDAVLHLDLKDNRARLKGSLNFDIQADYDLKSGDLSMSADFDHTDLGPYLRLADLAAWTGSLTGKLTARGQPRAMDTMEAALAFSDVGLFYDGKKILDSQQVSLDYRQGQVDFRSVQLKILEQGWLNVQGQAALNGPLGVRLEGHLPLQALQLFFDELGNPEGQLKLVADVGGTFNAPAMKGNIALEGIGLIVPGLDQRLHGLNGQIDISPRRIDIKTIEGMLDGGRLQLTGGADIQGLSLTAVSLNLKARELAIEPMADVEAVLDADLSLAGSAEKSLLTGKVALVEGYYERNMNLNLLNILGNELRLLKVRKRSFEGPSQTFGAADLVFVNNMQYDVGFLTRQPFVVDNNLAYMEISTDLKLKGSAKRPSVRGRAAVDSGTITFQGQAFEITNGVIDFINPYRIEPHLDITSEGQLGDYRVFLSLQGTVDELDLKLSSDPSLPDGDILSLILLGRTTRQLSEGTGGISGGDIAAGLLSTGLGSKVKRQTGIDTLQTETQPNEEVGGSTAAPVKITVGKNLNKRLAVKYQFTTGGDEAIQRTIAEYQLLENLLVSGYQENTGVFGGMFKYRLEFR